MPEEASENFAVAGLPMDGEPLRKFEDSTINVEDLDLWYGQKQALFGVNLSVRKNHISALIGPSGCGKSTLLRTLNRMNDLVDGCRTEGKIELEGQDIFASDLSTLELRTRVGMIFQKPNPFPMTIRDNITYGPKLHGITDRKELDVIVEESLRKAAIWNEVKDRLNTSAMALSGGQQQRLCIARALSINPEIILMDEPTSALDPIATSKIEDLATDLKKDYTVVIVTHNMQQASRISDYTGFMYLGKMIEFGQTKEVFNKPRKELTERYITGRFG
ncbi:MAG: phosphate ABC transporter ATP-binding protein PstB [Candidatus Methanomethylophilaceae archaeon]|nr:phosphate ABC transporter ATP-binding protein PstB [Candidatus Methanomethylophilaceae archaeon]